MSQSVHFVVFGGTLSKDTSRLLNESPFSPLELTEQGAYPLAGTPVFQTWSSQVYGKQYLFSSMSNDSGYGFAPSLFGKRMLALYTG